MFNLYNKMFIINCIISTGNLRPRAVRNFPTVAKQVELDSVQIPNLCHQHFCSNLLTSSLHPFSPSPISNSFWVNRRHLERELERERQAAMRQRYPNSGIRKLFFIQASVQVRPSQRGSLQAARLIHCQLLLV